MYVICATLLFLGVFLTHVSCESGCDGYINITEPWRNVNFTSTTFTGYPKYDQNLLNQWFRFIGIGGDTVIQTCLNTYHLGGTTYMIYVPSTLPAVESTVTGVTAYYFTGTCNTNPLTVNVVLCPGGFYVYKLLSSISNGGSAFVTYHNDCQPDSCGPLAKCTANGGCVCMDGYEIPSGYLPVNESYGCADIDECKKTSGICGSNSKCTNNIGSFVCTCVTGYEPTDPALPINKTNQCTDIDECLGNVCGDGGNCTNNEGSFVCTCHKGYKNVPKAEPVCQDIDECFNSTVCGPNCICTNTPGAFTCECEIGYAPTIRASEPNDTNICIDIEDCTEHITICGPDANCTNTIGSHTCMCFSGYRLFNPNVIASYMNPCLDIDECAETPGICGKGTVCTNAPGTFYCSCPDGYYPSTGIVWTLGVSFCKSIDDILNEITPPQGQTKQMAFLGHMEEQLKNNSDLGLPDATVANSFSASMEVSGVGPRARSIRVTSEGDGETGSMILGISDRLISSMVSLGENKTQRTVQSPTVELSLTTIGPRVYENSSTSLAANGNLMDINLQSLADANNGSAAAAFLTLNGMESLLSHQYFKTVNKTEMYSDVFTALLPAINNTNLTEPVNFTILHKKKVLESGMVTCVYWADMQWSVDGCWVTYTNENYTVCSCSHLSTFALIMQIGEPPPENPFLEWLNRICVIIGLFFFGLAILTFLLCSWNPKINNTARLHLCINLSLSHLLLLWNDKYVDNKLACTVMAGLLHFLVIASFVWMLLEALQLHLLVRRLTKVQVIQRDGLPKPLLYLVGYGTPFVVVGVSALVYSDGYGATEAQVCWLSTTRHFNWALTGPVIAILAMNWIMFCATLWSLRPTLANMKSDVSQSKDTRLIVFKILAQFVILGCTWILGLYQTNLFFQVLFIFLNSQQGTFLFIVHCLLNKEVREEYIRWLTCSCGQDITEQKDAPSVSEDIDKAEEK